MDDKQKIKIHKLIREIEKKKKLISSKSIENYIQLKKSEGITKLKDGTDINFSNINEKVHERLDTKEDFQEEEGIKILTNQNAFLEDIISGDSRMRIGGYIVSGLGIVVAVWIIGWVLSPSDKTTTTNTFEEEKKNAISKYKNRPSSRQIDIVSNSAWDSSVYQVEDYLKRTLKDPDSYQSIEWYKVKKTSTGYKVLHKYRAKNSFGGYVVQTTEFILDSQGNVISATNYK